MAFHTKIQSILSSSYQLDFILYAEQFSPHLIFTVFVNERFQKEANWIYFSFILTVIVANHGQYICTILSHLEVAGSKLWFETIPGSVRAKLKRVKLFTNVSENYSAMKKTS